MVMIHDFEPIGPVEPEVVDAYRDRVPPELVEIWEQYGYGTFGEGFVRVVNPVAYADALRDCLGKVTGQRIAIPIMVTGLADIICWEPGAGVRAIRYRDGLTRGLGTQLKTFLNLTRLDGSFHLRGP